jgi:alanine transaminase
MARKLFLEGNWNTLSGHIDVASPTANRSAPRVAPAAGSAVDESADDSDKPFELNRKFSVSNMDEKIVEAKYAVRGSVVQRAGELKKALAAGDPLPFNQLIFCNIGNPHAVNQKPITFYRQVAAALYMPELASDPDKLTASGLFPADVVERAQEYLKATGGNGVGSYTDSIGLQLVREQVASFIEERDGFPADPNSIALTTGASEGVKRCISAIIAGDQDGIMIPRPQYPLYSAALTMAGGNAIYYDLNEDAGWKTSFAELERAYHAATAAGTWVRALAIINPGNPVGAVLDEEDVSELVAFAAAKSLVILADEV